jgi:predicted ATPase
MQTLPSEMEHMLFFIVDNMNRGSTLIHDPDQKWEVARLNLEAGEKALKESAFQSAAKYLLAGVSFLGTDSWDVKYNLSLNLYDAGTSSCRHGVNLVIFLLAAKFNIITFGPCSVGGSVRYW